MSTSNSAIDCLRCNNLQQDFCVRQCLDDSSNWVTNVESDYDGQAFKVAGKLVPVDSVAGRYNEGVVLACSTPRSVTLIILLK